MFRSPEMSSLGGSIPADAKGRATGKKSRVVKANRSVQRNRNAPTKISPIIDEVQNIEHGIDEQETKSVLSSLLVAAAASSEYYPMQTSDASTSTASGPSLLSLVMAAPLVSGTARPRREKKRGPEECPEYLADLLMTGALSDTEGIGSTNSYILKHSKFASDSNANKDFYSPNTSATEKQSDGGGWTHISDVPISDNIGTEVDSRSRFDKRVKKR